MFHTELDSSQRLLTLSFSDHVGPEEMRAALEKIRSMLAGVTPGLHVLTDLTGLTAMEASCAPLIAETMELLKAKQIERVARVIPDPSKDIGFEIIGLFHYSGQVRTATFDNLHDAREYLGT